MVTVINIELNVQNALQYKKVSLKQVKSGVPEKYVIVRYNSANL